MKEIKLTQGHVALVDDDDFDYLSQFKWRIIKANRNVYAIRSVSPRINGKERIVWMHKDIFTKNGIEHEIIDHKNINGLDNQKCNLRACTSAQNGKNRRSAKNSSSKYLGVSWWKTNNAWVAQINRPGLSKYLGAFKSEKMAARAYNQAAIEVHGEFANLNSV